MEDQTAEAFVACYNNKQHLQIQKINIIKYKLLQSAVGNVVQYIRHLCYFVMKADMICCYIIL